MPELAYVNGTISPISEALVPIEDRGYQFGDAVYEYIAGYDFRLFCLDEHLKRLERSLKELDFPEISMETIRDEILRLVDASGIKRSGIYIQISRGVAPRNHPFPDVPPQIIMTVREIPEKHEYADCGVSVVTFKDIRWKRCDIKTVQLLPNVMAKQKAIEAGAYDSIFVSKEGIVREATSSNIFAVKENRVITHPLNERILPGITRMMVIRLCTEEGIAVEERTFDLAEMFDADELFLTGTVTEVLPVVSVDGRTIGRGIPGELTSLLYDALRNAAYGI